MRGILFLFAGAVAMLPLGAHAADQKTLGCIVEHLDAPTIALIQSNGETVIRTPPGDAMPALSEAGLQAISAAARDCAALHGWSPAATGAAVAYTVATVARPGTERALRGFGIDPAPLAQLYDGLPATVRETPMTQSGPWQAALTNLALQAQARHLFDPAQSRRAGRYVGSLNVIDFSRAAFLRS